MVDLFCGGGLGAIGMEAAGFDIIAAYDNDKRAVEAYRYNFGDHVRLADINELDAEDIPDADVFFGGPPCQDFSVAGTGAGEKGERGKLVWSYLRIIEAKKPKAFIFENVKGLITKRHRPTFDALVEKFEEIGYNVSWKLINAWDYGVAQKRERVFIVGIRKDLGFTYEFPEPEPEDYRTKVLRDVIGDLPEPNGGVNAHVQTQATTVKSFQSLSNQRSYVADWNKPARTVNTNRLDHAEIHPGPLNHDPQPLSEKALEYLHRDPRHLKKHRPPTVDEPSPTLLAVLHKGVPYGLFYPPNHVGAVKTKEYGKREKGVGRHPISTEDEPAYTIVSSATGGKNAFYPNHIGGVISKEYHGHTASSIDKPAKTIVAGVHGVPSGANCIRTTQAPRRFTVRECLRIQSVPDWYVLPDTLSLSAQYRIVGNGIPSRVAWYLGRALASQLKGAMSCPVISA